MGMKLIIPGASFPATNPKLATYDSLESAGSLALFNPGSVTGGAFAGTPSGLRTIPNVVADIARDVIGAAPVDDLNLDAALDIYDAGTFITERTSKGGIHGISSHAGGQVGGNNYQLKLDVSNPIHQYIEDHRATNEFYISFWYRLTRAALAGSAPQSLAHWAFNTGAYSFYSQHTGSPVANGESIQNPAGFSHIDGSDEGIVVRRAIKFGDWSSGFVATPLFMGLLGNDGAWQSHNLNKAPSGIFYRSYIEDLTVSGRSFDELNGLDAALFDAEFAAGGAFFGDTYSDPDAVLL